ncbi:hypothetical protein [Sphingomonas koreensis]|uniref:hypothetical protein n=1 Tax=Sphingomonas koreensis TaxID=93064 RepID=UPI0013E059CA|nr:hypothetical protein [Sphingomonas koreensis]
MLRQFTRLQLRGIVAALLVSLVGAGFSAHAGFSALSAGDEFSYNNRMRPQTDYA